MAKKQYDTPVFDLALNQGDDMYFNVALKYKDGAPIDITGCEFKCKAKTSAEDEDVLFQAEAEILDAKNGLVQFHFKDEDTREIDTDGDDYSQTNQYTYDVLMKDANGDVTRVLNGYIYVSPGISWDDE